MAKLKLITIDDVAVIGTSRFSLLETRLKLNFDSKRKEENYLLPDRMTFAAAAELSKNEISRALLVCDKLLNHSREEDQTSHLSNMDHFHYFLWAKDFFFLQTTIIAVFMVSMA